MSTKVAFVVSIGRMSAGNESALPKVQGLCAQFGGKVTGGVGSSVDPILAEFADSAGAAKAAQQAFYIDDIEAAKVLGADGSSTMIAPVTEPGGKSQDRGPSQFPKDFGVKEAVAAVIGGKTVVEAVDALLAAPVEEATASLEFHHGPEGLHPDIKNRIASVGGTVHSTFGGKTKASVPAQHGKAVASAGEEVGHTVFRGSIREDVMEEAVNRWGHKLTKGLKVKVAHARMGVEDDEIEGFEKPDEMSKAYGKQVRLKSGKTCTADDCIPA